MRSSRHTTAAREEAPRVSVDSACAPLKIKYESNRGRRPLSCPSAELTTAPRGQVLALVRHAQHDARAADGGRLRRFDGGQPRPRLPRCIPVSESTNALNRWAPSTSTSSSRRRTTPRGARRRTRQRRPRRPPSLASSRRTRRCSSTTSGGGARVSGVCSHSAGCEQAMQLDLEEALTRPVAGEGQQMPQPRGRLGEIGGDLGRFGVRHTQRRCRLTAPPCRPQARGTTTCRRTWSGSATARASCSAGARSPFAASSTRS